LWSAEHLTRTSVSAAIAFEGRSNRFHPELRLPPSERAELSDYRKSGFDRGHMAPSGDMPGQTAGIESFTLANVVPQARRLNQGSWAQLEGIIRDTALANGEAYVVTGPLYEGRTIAALKGRVLVPTSTWKALYVPGRGAAAYIATNDNQPRWQRVSVTELTRRSAIDPFPSLDPATKATTAAFPLPTSKRKGSGR
jgi:endonuclease G